MDNSRFNKGRKLDEKKNIVYKNVLVNGDLKKIPVLHKIKRIPIITGVEFQEHEFPIKDWFNDSVTSSSIDLQESAFIRMVDDIAVSLVLRSMENNNVNYTAFLNRLYFMKASVSDTSKGVGGRAMEMAKTTINKGESMVQMYRKMQFDEEVDKRKKSGLLGLGLFGIL